MNTQIRGSQRCRARIWSFTICCASNITQLELAQFSGVQQADISRIENGQSFPTTETLAKLLQALQARVNIELVS
jgi:predicted transcriptional regulator